MRNNFVVIKKINCFLLALSMFSCNSGYNSSRVEDQSLKIKPIGSGAILNASFKSNFDTFNSIPLTQFATITNSGNGTAQLTIVADQGKGLSISSGSGACGVQLEANSSCKIYFTISNPKGSANINLSYNGISGALTELKLPVAWYSSAQGALLSLYNNIESVAITSNALTPTILFITIKNIGDYQINNLKLSTSSSGVVKDTLPYDDSCSAKSISLNGVCKLKINLSDDIIEQGIIKLKVSGDYNSSDGVKKNYSRIFNVGYRSNKLPRYILMDKRGILLHSDDLVSWKSSPVDVANLDILGATYGNGLIVAASDQKILTSSDGGVTWSINKSSVSNQLWGINYGDGRFIAVTNSAQLSSSIDGYEWSSTRTSWTFPSSAIAYADKTWVLGGYDKDGKIYTSTDGVNWTYRYSMNNAYWQYATYADGVWIMVGLSAAAISVDGGISWSGYKIPTNEQLWSVAYGDGVFIAVGSGAAIFSSADNGITWQAESSDVTNHLRSIKYCNSTFVVTMSGEFILYSKDKGKTWIKNRIPASADYRSLICTDTK